MESVKETLINAGEKIKETGESVGQALSNGYHSVVDTVTGKKDEADANHHEVKQDGEKVDESEGTEEKHDATHHKADEIKHDALHCVENSAHSEDKAHEHQHSEGVVDSTTEHIGDAAKKVAEKAHDVQG